MKLKFATGHVALRLSISEMQTLVAEHQLREEISLSGGAMQVVVSLVDEQIANMGFDPSNATIGFVFPKKAAEAELAKPTRGGIGGFFDEGVFSLAIDMHDVRDRSRK